MASEDRHSSDSESLTTDTSDMTSRATTPQTSWSVSSLQRKMNRLNQFNIQPIEGDRTSIHSTTDEPVVPDKGEPQNEQQRHTSVDPLSNLDTKSGTKQTDNNTNIEHSSSPIQSEQVIPNSSLINERSESSALLKKLNLRFSSSTPNTSFNSGSNYISDDNDVTDVYPAPTPMRRRVLTSSIELTVFPDDQSGFNQSSAISDADTDFRSQFDQRQTFSEETDNNFQSWVDPIVPKPNQISSEHPEKKNSSQIQSPQSSKHSEKSFTTNHDLDIKFSDRSTPSTETSKNASPKDSPTSKKQQEKSRQKLSRKDSSPTKRNKKDAALQKSVSSKHKSPPIPSFYRRVYPPSTPLSSPVTTKTTKHKTNFTSGISRNNSDDDDDISYTIDSRGVAHYLPPASSPNVTYKTLKFPSSSTKSQYPVLPVYKYCSEVPSLEDNISSTLFTNVSSRPSFSFDYNTSPASSCVNVLTEAELNNVHDVLHSLNTNRNTIPMMEMSDHILSTNTSRHNNRSSLLACSGTRGRQLPSSFLRNKQYCSQQLPLFSSPSYPSNRNQILHRPTIHRSVVLI